MFALCGGLWVDFDAGLGQVCLSVTWWRHCGLACLSSAASPHCICIGCVLNTSSWIQEVLQWILIWYLSRVLLQLWERPSKRLWLHVNILLFLLAYLIFGSVNWCQEVRRLSNNRISQSSLGSGRRSGVTFPFFYVLLPLILKQSKVFTRLVKSIMLSVKSVNYIILVDVNLIINIDIFFNEVDELLHLCTEEKVDLIRELGAQDFNPLFARALVWLSLTLWTIVNRASAAWLITCIGRSMLSSSWRKWVSALVLPLSCCSLPFGCSLGSFGLRGGLQRAFLASLIWTLSRKPHRHVWQFLFLKSLWGLITHLGS